MPSRFCIQYVSNLEDPTVAIGLEKVNSHPNPKKGSTKEYANHRTTGLISHVNKVMLGFSIMWTKNFQMSKLGLEKEEKLEIKLPTFADYRDSKGISEKHLSLFHQPH